MKTPTDVAVAKQHPLQAALEAKAMLPIKNALPSHLNADRMVRLIWSCIRNSPELMKCTPDSIIIAAIKCGETGLEPNALGHAYLIPFKRNSLDKATGKWTNTLEAQFIPGYRGLVDLARRSGELSTIFAAAVYKGDDFGFEMGDTPLVYHAPNLDADQAPENITHFYAVAKLKDGGVQREVMSRKQVEAIRARSKAKDNGPWVTDFAEMGKKTVLRRLCKMLPASIQLATAIEADDRAEAGLTADMGEAEIVEPQTPSLEERAQKAIEDQQATEEAPAASKRAPKATKPVEVVPPAPEKPVEPVETEAQGEEQAPAAQQVIPTGTAFGEIFDTWSNGQQTAYETKRQEELGGGTVKEDAHKIAYLLATAQ